jgi:hypothetical protein
VLEAAFRIVVEALDDVKAGGPGDGRRPRHRTGRRLKKEVEELKPPQRLTDASVVLGAGFSREPTLHVRESVRDLAEPEEQVPPVESGEGVGAPVVRVPYPPLDHPEVDAVADLAARGGHRAVPDATPGDRRHAGPPHAHLLEQPPREHVVLRALRRTLRDVAAADEAVVLAELLRPRPKERLVERGTPGPPPRRDLARTGVASTPGHSRMVPPIVDRGHGVYRWLGHDRLGPTRAIR